LPDYLTGDLKLYGRHSMEIISNIALITINETVFVQIISFLIFVFILNRIMVRPLSSTMGERETYINNLQQGVEDAEKEMDVLTGKLKERESEAKKEAFAFKADLEDSGKSEASEIFAGAREEIEVLKKDAAKEVESQIAEAKKYISKESEILATSIMEKVLERRLT
jgi:F-type H+-transporting ATPase subunit b